MNYLDENLHFIDCDHLNEAGAELFNEKLLVNDLKLLIELR